MFFFYFIRIIRDATDSEYCSHPEYNKYLPVLRRWTLTIKTYLVIPTIICTLASCTTTGTKQSANTSEDSKVSQQTLSSSDSTSLIEKKAQQVLKQMTDALSTSPAYSFNALTIKEQVLPSGQKLQYDSAISVKMQRPNALFVNEISGVKKKTLWYQNTQLTLLDKAKNFYATTKTPDNTEDTLDFIMEKYQVSMPLADFVFKDLYKNLTENVLSGFYVAQTEINSVKTHHLAFHQNNLDWQIWIDAEGKPVPRKFVITYNDKTSTPQFVAFFKDWNLSPQFKPNEFSFIQPKDAVKIEFYSKNKQ